MELDRLAVSYVRKARARRKALDVLYQERSYSDVVREAQELSELALKAVLRAIGIEPPKFHDVGKLIRGRTTPPLTLIARWSWWKRSWRGSFLCSPRSPGYDSVSLFPLRCRQ